MVNNPTDVTISVGIEFEQAKRKLAEVSKSVRSKTSRATKAFEPLIEAQNRFRVAQQKVQAQTKRLQGTFQAWALGIMFAGQALKNFFLNIFKSSSKTFNEVMHSVEGTTTGFDMLSGSVEYLKFTAGQALEPLTMLLIPIVDKVSEWIQNNEELFRTIVAVGVVVGTLLATVGSVVLAVSSLKTAFANVGALLTGPAGPLLLALIALGALSWKAFSETPEAWEAIKKVVSTLEKPIQNVLGAFEGLLQLVWEDFELDWEGVAALIVLGAKVIAGALGIIINSFALVTTTILRAITVLKGWGAALTGQDTSEFIDKAEEQRQKMFEIQRDLKQSYMDLGSALMSSPQDLVNQWRAERQTTWESKTTNYTNYITIDGVAVGSTNTPTWSNLADEISQTSQRYS